MNKSGRRCVFCTVSKTCMITSTSAHWCEKYVIKLYNIARALVLSKSYWAIMNKIFMYAWPCSIKWRVKFHFSCKVSFEFSASSFCLSFDNVKIILNNPNPTSSLWLLPCKDVYFNVSINLTLFVSIFTEYATFSLQFSLIRRSEFSIDNFRDQVKRFRSTVANWLWSVRIKKTFQGFPSPCIVRTNCGQSEIKHVLAPKLLSPC